RTALVFFQGEGSAKKGVRPEAKFFVGQTVAGAPGALPFVPASANGRVPRSLCSHLIGRPPSGAGFFLSHPVACARHLCCGSPSLPLVAPWSSVRCVSDVPVPNWDPFLRRFSSSAPHRRRRADFFAGESSLFVAIDDCASSPCESSS
ncbi:unnamed protein product, partial [Ixodes persulcatus]